MIDKKKLMQDGYEKGQKVLVIIYDRNLKEHFVLFNTMEEAKKYCDKDVSKRMITIYEK